GSLGVMCDVSLSLDNLTRLMTPGVMIKWVPGVGFGAAIFFILLKKAQVLILPASLVIGALLFYLVLAVTGTGVHEAKTAGFLISGVPSQGLWPAFSFADLSLVQWRTAMGQVPAIFSVALVSVVGMLLNMSGIEVGARSDLNINGELMVFGAGNMVAGGFCSVPGYPSISLSLLTHKAGADSRLTGIIAALIVGAVLFFGGNLLEYFPKCILGGLVLLLGLLLVHDWIISTKKRLPMVDWLIVVFIFLVTGIFGFMEGVGAGLVATIIFFVVRFSRVPVIKQSFTAKERTSPRARSVPHRHMLQSGAAGIQGYELSGYLFFGSASALLDSLKTRLMTRPAPAYMLLDFKQVTGFDISAINHFQRVVLTAKTTGCVIVVTSAPHRFADAVRKNFPQDVLENISFFETLNDGLEWCEDDLIRNLEAALSAETGLRETMFDRSVDDVLKQLETQEFVELLVHELGDWLRPENFPAGSIIIEKGQATDAFYLITWGNAIEYDPGSGRRFRFLEQGCVIEGPAPFAPHHTAAATIMADTDCKTASLSFRSRQMLEKENPELAIRLYGYLIQSAGDRTQMS
ncbi:MAG: SulP family inorganic anion transporter, partial [Pseudomonadota bacterium]